MQHWPACLRQRRSRTACLLVYVSSGCCRQAAAKTACQSSCRQGCAPG